MPNIFDSLGDLNRMAPSPLAGVGLEEYTDLSVLPASAKSPSKRVLSFLPFFLIGLFVFFVLRGKK